MSNALSSNQSMQVYIMSQKDHRELSQFLLCVITIVRLYLCCIEALLEYRLENAMIDLGY